MNEESAQNVVPRNATADSRATEYLNRLAERNRLKRINNAKSKDQVSKELLERGFNTHFRGANASPAENKGTPGNKDVTKIFVSNRSPLVRPNNAGHEVIRPLKSLLFNAKNDSDSQLSDVQPSFDLQSSVNGLQYNSGVIDANKNARYASTSLNGENDDLSHVEGEANIISQEKVAPSEGTVLDASLLHHIEFLSQKQQDALLNILLARNAQRVDVGFKEASNNSIAFGLSDSNQKVTSAAVNVSSPKGVHIDEAFDERESNRNLYNSESGSLILGLTGSNVGIPPQPLNMLTIASPPQAVHNSPRPNKGVGHIALVSDVSESLSALRRGPSPIQTKNNRPLWLQADDVHTSSPDEADLDRPSWLPREPPIVKDDMKNVQIPIISRSRPSSGMQRPSPYRSGDLSSSIAPSSAVQAQSTDSVEQKSKGTDSSASARRRRRNDVQQQNASDQTHLDAMVGAWRRSPKEEEEMRHSLEALSIADKSNLGRISSRLLDTVNSLHEAEPQIEVSRSLFHSDSRTNILPHSIQATELSVRENSHTGDVARIQVRSGPVKVGALLSSSPHTQALTRQGSRTSVGNVMKRKIDLTNEKVQCALADLQDVLAGLQGPSVVGTGLIGEGFSSPILAQTEQQRTDSTSAGQTADNRACTPEPIISKVESSPVFQREDFVAIGHHSEMISIPTLPQGRELTLEILSTWGDPHYVGLSGIDIFDASGACLVPATDAATYAAMGLTPLNIRVPNFASVRRRASIVSIYGDPPDINVLPEYGSDPRTAANLLDGTNFTRDDLHVWLAPIGHCQAPSTSDGARPIAVIKIEFSTVVAISMIRVFNYNKSRTHVVRGVRLCRILLDGIPVFMGELRMASGLLSSPEQVSECILFTTDNTILTEIARHDEVRGYYVPDATSSWVSKLLDRHQAQRPTNIDNDGIGGSSETLHRHRRAPEQARMSDTITITSGEQRPATQASYSTRLSHANSSKVSSPKVHAKSPSGTHMHNSSTKISNIKSNIISIQSENNEEHSDDDIAFMQELRMLNAESIPETEPSVVSVESKNTREEQWQDHEKFLCSGINIEIESAWDPGADYVGLMGLQVLTASGPAYVSSHNIRAECDGDSADFSSDSRVPSHLVDGINECTDDSHAWLAAFIRETPPRLCLQLSAVEQVLGLRIWNYNKADPPESILRGVKSIKITVCNDAGLKLSIGRAILRPGPGCDCVSFAQTLFLQDVKQGLHCGPVLKNSPLASLGANGTIPRYIPPAINQDYEAPSLPCGALWKIVISENWNDGYFVGLDGLEIFDHTGSRVVPFAKEGSVEEFHVLAVPSSINDLHSGAPTDPRTPNRLFFRDDHDRPGSPEHQPWLAPLAQCMTSEERHAAFVKHFRKSHGTAGQPGRMAVSTDSNVIFLLFQRPIALSAIRFFNYAKTPTRGVRHFSLYCDHKLVFMGSLVCADKEKMAGGQRCGQALLLSSHPRVVKTNRELVTYCGALDQDVLCVNERKVMVRSRNMYNNAPNVAADGISSDLTQRPRTSAHNA